GARGCDREEPFLLPLAQPRATSDSAAGSGSSLQELRCGGWRPRGSNRNALPPWSSFLFRPRTRKETGTQGQDAWAITTWANKTPTWLNLLDQRKIEKAGF